MSSSDKNFVRNLCLFGGLFFAFLLISPIRFGPAPVPAQPLAVNTPDEPAITASVTATSLEEAIAETSFVQEVAEYLDIPLTIGDVKYRFSISKNKENIRELAAQVCNENAAALSITTTADLETLCVVPVVNSLSEQVDLTLAQVVPIDLNIGGRSVKFEVDTADSGSIGHQASTFCTNYGAEFGVTQETLSECIQNVVLALESRISATKEVQQPQAPVQQQQEEQSAPKFQTNLDIQGRNVRFEVEATYESIGEQASTFCTTHGAEFGVTAESLAECQQNIQRALEERIVAHLLAQQTPPPAPVQPQQQANPTFQTDLDIQGRVVRFNVEATYESIGEQASTFCTTHGAEFGVTAESLAECQQNIQRALEERIVAHLRLNESN